jgi:hypothetical protein
VDANRIDVEAVVALGAITTYDGIYHGVYKEADHG